MTPSPASAESMLRGVRVKDLRPLADSLQDVAMRSVGRAERSRIGRPGKRQGKAGAAMRDLIQAIFWRVLADDHAASDPQALVLDLEDAHVGAGRLQDAEARLLAAGHAGMLAPKLITGAVAWAASDRAVKGDVA